MAGNREDYYAFFRRNFPHIVREERTARKILDDPKGIALEKRENGVLEGLLILQENHVLLLAVDKPYRGRGIGSDLLYKAENLTKEAGFCEITVGVGEDYLAPGVPTGKAIYAEKLHAEHIYPGEDDAAVHFFMKRGYYHAEKDANIFDMRLDWSDYPENSLKIGQEINGILYRFATTEDMEGIKACTDDAEESFTKYYMQKELYQNGPERVLLAENAGEVVGVLMIEAETEEKGLGSVGCTAVKTAYQRRHIASNMVMLGTDYLKELGMQSAYLGYTYSGLDKLYGASGYKACIYYFMAHKKLLACGGSDETSGEQAIPIPSL